MGKGCAVGVLMEGIEAGARMKSVSGIDQGGAELIEFVADP